MHTVSEPMNPEIICALESASMVKAPRVQGDGVQTREEILVQNDVVLTWWIFEIDASSAHWAAPISLPRAPARRLTTASRAWAARAPAKPTRCVRSATGIESVAGQKGESLR
jgi:hypothetical protein